MPRCPRRATRAGRVLAGLVMLALAGIVVLRATPAAGTILAPGTDLLDVSGEVSVTSLLGSETIPLSGTVTIQRSGAQIQGGAYVIDAEIIAMDLAGTSITGPIAVVESATLVSSGEIRSLQQAPDKFPASSFFDVFIVVTLPASPAPTVTRRNLVPLHLVPVSGGSELSLGEWPPIGAKYRVVPAPCVPLVPTLPQNLCVTSLSIAITGPLPTATATPTATAAPTPLPTSTPDPVGGIAELAEVAGTPLEATSSPGSDAGVVAGVAVAVAAGVVVLGGAARYARRRRL